MREYNHYLIGMGICEEITNLCNASSIEIWIYLLWQVHCEELLYFLVIVNLLYNKRYKLFVRRVYGLIQIYWKLVVIFFLEIRLNTPYLLLKNKVFEVNRLSFVINSGEVAKLFADAGLICIASLISPYRKDRDACRAMMLDEHFIEASPSMVFTCFKISYILPPDSLSLSHCLYYMYKPDFPGLSEHAPGGVWGQGSQRSL